MKIDENSRAISKGMKSPRISCYRSGNLADTDDASAGTVKNPYLLGGSMYIASGKVELSPST